jgi:hypothetical protein
VAETGVTLADVIAAFDLTEEKMSDTIVASGSQVKFKVHPDGQFVGQCVDTIDMGEKLEEYPGSPAKVVHKCVLVFRTGEKNEDTGEYIDISREFTVSMGDKANLRKFLEQWRGKPYDDAAIKQGVPLHKLTGNHGLLTVAHNSPGGGKVYANIAACVGVPKQMQGVLVSYDDYERADFWAKRREQYAEAVREFRGEQATGGSDLPSPFDPDDADLPF